MAHPNIDIDQQPNPDCLNPVYNCVKYCFTSNSFKVSSGTKADFTIQLPVGVVGYGAGGVITIAGQTYTTGTTNSYNTVNTAPVQDSVQFATNFKAALEANSDLFNKFTFAVVGVNPNAQLVATAREVGEIEDFTFDFSALAPTPPVNTSNQGTEDVYLDNYKIVVDIWKCIGGAPSVLISSEAYSPNSDGEFCLNVGEKVSPLVSTRFVHDLSTGIAWYQDVSIVERICLRYGEIYSDSIQECEVEPRDFDTTSEIRIVNSAFQRRGQQDKIDDMCEGQFMTNMPDFTKFCESSIIYLWANLFDIIQDPAPPNTTYHPFIEFTYTDGSTSIHVTTLFSATPGDDGNKMYAIGSGFPTIGFLADPGKTVDFWRMRIVCRDNSQTIPNGDTYFSSKYFKLVSCCEGDAQFYFLNEFGGYDTILFQQVDSIEIQQNKGVFESFIDCEENDALRSGKDIIDQSARDVYTVTSKFVNEYQTRKWLREFITSPKKYVNVNIEGNDDTFEKVIVLTDSIQYYSKDDNFIYLELQYILNEDINLHKN